MPAEQEGVTTAELPRMRRVALVAGRLLIFLAVVLFMGLWTWFFVTALLARQYSWSFWSLLLFALFLLVLTIAPRGRAARVELGLASAKVLIDYEAPRGAEAVVERVKEGLPAEARPAFEKVEPRLLEETARALLTISERAAMQALASSSTAALPTAEAITWSDLGSLTWADFEDRARTAAVRRAIERRLARKPTDPSSGSVR